MPDPNFTRTRIEIIIDLIKELNLTDLTALNEVIGTRRYKMREAEQKKFEALLII